VNTSTAPTRTPRGATTAADAPIAASIGLGLRRALLVGGAFGWAVVWAVATAAALSHGVQAAEALALGAFVGFWGGAGLGSMVAASIPLARYLPPPATVPVDRTPD
jgi:hypothetical protein